MVVTATEIVITASIYPKHQLVGIKYYPIMAATASSDPSLIPSVSQFRLRLLHECYY